jgi:hypothetical protein
MCKTLLIDLGATMFFLVPLFRGIYEQPYSQGVQPQSGSLATQISNAPLLTVLILSINLGSVAWAGEK